MCTQYDVSAVLHWSHGQVIKCHHLHWKRPFYQLCESKYNLKEGGNFSPHIGIIINAVRTYYRKFSERKRFNSVQINLKEKVKRVSPNFTNRLKKQSTQNNSQSTVAFLIMWLRTGNHRVFFPLKQLNTGRFPNSLSVTPQYGCYVFSSSFTLRFQLHCRCMLQIFVDSTRTPIKMRH